MKKYTFLLTAGLFTLGFAGCDSKITETINIPAGEYTLLDKRDFRSLLCGMSEATFGKTLLINKGKIETHPLKGSETVVYNIERIGNADYLTKVYRPLKGDTVTIEFTHDETNNALCFPVMAKK